MQWVVASIAWSVGVGLLGIVLKLSLRDVKWPTIVLAATIAYIVLTIGLAAKGMLQFGQINWRVATLLVLAAALTAATFPLLMVALQLGDAGRVIPITATYPAVTALLGLFLLNESLNFQQLAGVALVIVGAILVAK